MAQNHNRTVIGIVAYALFMDYFIYGLILPLGPYSPWKASSEAETGALFCAYALGILVATPVFASLGDRLGCKRPMIIGVLLSGSAVALLCLAGHFYVALLARLLQGAAAAASWTAGLALVAENYPAERVAMMGLAMVGSTAGSVIGPVAGGFLYDKGGYTLPFLVTGVLVAIDAALRIFVLPKDKGTADKSPDLKTLMLDKSVLVSGFAVAVAAAGWGIIEPLLPNNLRAGGVAPAQVGWIFTTSTICYGLAAPLVAKVTEKVSIKKTICFGVVSMALCLPLLALSNNLYVCGLCLCLVNVSYAFVLNPASAELGNAVDRLGMNCYAAVYAVYNITYSLGMMGSDIFASAAAEHLSFLQILIAMSVILAASVPVVLKCVEDVSPTAVGAEAIATDE